MTKVPLVVCYFLGTRECSLSSIWPWHKQRKTRLQAEAKRRHPVGTGCLALYPRKSNGVKLWHKQARGWKYEHERRLRQSQTGTLCSAVPIVIAAATVFWPSFYIPVGHPHFIHHRFLRLSLSAPCILTSPYFLPSLSPSLILLWPESQGRWSVQADAPPPSLSKWEKQSLDPKQTKAAGGRQAGMFTVQLIYDLTVFGFSSTGRQEAHRWSPKKKIDQSQRPILMLWNTLDLTDVGTPLRQSDVPDSTVNKSNCPTLKLSIEWSEYKSRQVPKIWFLLISLSKKDLAKSSKQDWTKTQLITQHP